MSKLIAGVSFEGNVDVRGGQRVEVSLDARDRERWGALDALPSPVAVTGPDGLVCWTNAAWTHQSRERWTKPVEAAGAHYLAVCRQGIGFSREAIESIGAGLRAVLSGERATFEHELACHPEGSEAWYSVTVTPCTIDGRRGAMIQHTDVTDLRQADRRRTVARAVARAMEREDARREMLQNVVATVSDAMGWCLAATWTWDHATGVLRCDNVQPRSLTASYGWSAVTTAAGIAARVWGDHEPRWFDEIDREDASVMRTALGGQSERVREAVGVPVGRDGHVDGVVVFYSTHAHRPEAALLKLLAMLFTGARWSPASITDTRPAGAAEPGDERSTRSFASIAAQSMAPALVRGERGAGKARLAREIHGRSERARGPYVECNCASLKAASAEDELFGHEAGAIPGASRARRGLLEEASGGTLVLRDVGALDALTQVRLLKALEARSIRRIGGAREVRVDARVIATSATDLSAAVAAGDFDADLLRHLSAIVVEVAPLRERGDELEDIARRVIDDVARSYNRPAPALPPEALRALRGHRWSGNVREMRSALERAWLGVGPEVSAASVVAALATLQAKAANDTGPARGRPRQRASTPAPAARPSAAPRPLPVAAPAAPIGLSPLPEGMTSSNVFEILDPSELTLSSFERAHIERVLKHTSFNMRRAAQILGISRSTLYLRAKDYKLDLGTSRRSGRVEVDELAANDTDAADEHSDEHEMTAAATGT